MWSGWNWVGFRGGGSSCGSYAYDNEPPIFTRCWKSRDLLAECWLLGERAVTSRVSRVMSVRLNCHVRLLS